MTVERRLARVESALTPTMLVRRWLIEAQGHDSFTSYTSSLFAARPDLLPLDLLVRDARTGAEAAARGQPRDERERAIRRAIGQTIFLFRLALRTIVLAEEALDREALVQVALAAHLGLVAADDGSAHRAGGPSQAERLGMLRDAALGRAAELQALEAARSRVEAQYLDGGVVLFPQSLRRWAEQRERTEGLADLAVRLAELDGLAPAAPSDPAGLEARVVELVADHVEPARSEALDELGDGRRAAAVAMRWLQPKLD